jgi:plasmid stabilization system protein ParE
LKRPVRVLRRAQIDLLEIQAYVLRDDPGAAEGLVDALIDRLRRLETLSDRGALPRGLRLRRAGYRYVVHGDYLIFYEVLPSQVRVYRVIHGRRRYARLL